jgi:hypothetical protein
MEIAAQMAALHALARTMSRTAPENYCTPKRTVDTAFNGGAFIAMEITFDKAKRQQT